MTIGSNPSILLICPSSPNSPKNKPSSSSERLVTAGPSIDRSNATAIGISKLVPVLRISEGERLSINLRLGISTPEFLNAERIRSFASLMVVSGSQIISIVGKDLLVSTSMVISLPRRPCIA